MSPVLLDTSCIVALLDRSERCHRRCVEAVTNLEATLVTCEAVIAESCYLMRTTTGAVDAILANVDRGVFQIPFRLTDSMKRARSLLRRYSKVPMDFADACLVCIANELKTGRILTLDRDFEVYRWHRNRSFEMLIALD